MESRDYSNSSLNCQTLSKARAILRCPDASHFLFAHCVTFCGYVTSKDGTILTPSSMIIHVFSFLRGENLRPTQHELTVKHNNNCIIRLTFGQKSEVQLSAVSGVHDYWTQLLCVISPPMDFMWKIVHKRNIILVFLYNRFQQIIIEFVEVTEYQVKNQRAWV